MCINYTTLHHTIHKHTQTHRETHIHASLYTSETHTKKLYLMVITEDNPSQQVSDPT